MLKFFKKEIFLFSFVCKIYKLNKNYKENKITFALGCPKKHFLPELKGNLWV
jgi:hypothetical protein